MITCRTLSGEEKRVQLHDLIFRVAAYAFLVDQENLLVMDVPISSKFSLPGGGIEKGESVADGLIREVQEETGLSILPGKLITLTEDFFYEPKKQEARQTVLLFYTATIVKGDLKNLIHTSTGESFQEIPQWQKITTLKPKDFIPPVTPAFKTWQSN